MNTFEGGVHPYDGKDISKEGSVKTFRPKGEVAIFLSQHIGAPAKSVVAKGDRVLRYQLVAEAGGFVSANIYASVSGTVKGIEKRRTPVGDMADAIIIDNDGLFEEAPLTAPEDPMALDRDEKIEAVRRAGVVGMGGAGFPTSVKLSPKDPSKIEYIIANCAECEPYLTSDYRMMIEQPEEIIGGVKLVLSLFDGARGIIAIEDNKPDCIDIMKKLCENEDRIEVKPLMTKYPQGSERQMIYATVGRKVNSTMLPADVGCIVNNADSMIAIYRAITKGEPLVDRIVTVTGDAVKRPGNYRVPVGTNMRELLEDAGAFEETVAAGGDGAAAGDGNDGDGAAATGVTYGELIADKIVCGGPMMGFALFEPDVPVTKTSSALLCIKDDQVKKTEATPCIKCGMCVEACPSRIMPTNLAAFADHGDEERFLEYKGLECMECGCCSYICPAGRSLTQSIKGMRREILAKRKKK